MDDQSKPSEHVRLELQILGDTIEEVPARTTGSQSVLVVASDPIVRIELEDRLRAVPGIQVLIGIGDGRPDLIVRNAESATEVTVSVAPFDAESLAAKIVALMGIA